MNSRTKEQVKVTSTTYGNSDKILQLLSFAKNYLCESTSTMAQPDQHVSSLPRPSSGNPSSEKLEHKHMPPRLPFGSTLFENSTTKISDVNKN
jgi:hypothetical protein